MTAAAFFDFARKRHQIYLDRSAGRPEPWTDDPILGRYRFTNVFRELDRTTEWFAHNVRDCLSDVATPHNQVLSTILFRTLNRIPSGEVLFCQPDLFGGEAFGWQYVTADCGIDDVEGVLRRAIPNGPWVTGAYIVKTPDGMDKLHGALWIVDQARLRLPGTLAELGPHPSLESFHRALQSYPFIGGFTGYEIVSDLRHMPILSSAPDIMSWAHAGPGAVRGLNRVHGRPLRAPLRQEQARREMEELLVLGGQRDDWWPNDWPMWEMREVEHTLCEFDKYERVRLGEGKPRGRFR